MRFVGLVAVVVYLLYTGFVAGQAYDTRRWDSRVKALGLRIDAIEKECSK